MSELKTAKDDKFTSNCISCKAPDEAEMTRIFYEDGVCKAVLRTDNQCWLGRYIVVPKTHMDPMDFWTSDVSRHVMQVHVICAQAVTKAFGAVPDRR